MNGKRFPLFVFLMTLGTACDSGLAAEPILDLRAPQTGVTPRPFTVMHMDDRPAWMQGMDTVARHGLTFMCLHRGQQANLVLGANPNGYVGIFTKLPGGGRRGRSGC